MGGTLVTDIGPKAMFINKNIVRVNSPEMAMKVAAVYRCVDILSSGVAMLPFEKKRYNRAQEYFMTDRSDRTNYLIKVKPNRHMTSYELKRNAVIQLLMCGNAYIIPHKAHGQVSELILCSPYSVSHDSAADLYMVNDTINSITGTFSPEDILHLRGMSLDGGRTGVSVITYASTVLGIQASGDAESLNLFAQGGRIKGIISNNTSQKGFGLYQDAELKKVATGVEEILQSGRDIFMLPGETQFTPLSMTSIDMQLLEQKKFGVAEICRFFGVHPDKVFAQQSTNYKASEMSQVSFLTDTLRPILCKIEAEFNAKLIPEQYYEDYKFEFDTTPIYTTDLSTESVYMEKTISTGVMTVNDWRRRKNLKPTKGGDTTLVSCNVAPIDSAKIKGDK